MARRKPPVSPDILSRRLAQRHRAKIRALTADLDTLKPAYVELGVRFRMTEERELLWLSRYQLALKEWHSASARIVVLLEELRMAGATAVDGPPIPIVDLASP